ncbi:MAG: glycosyltransferase family 2 protein [Pontiellaceae bacterium]|nr:glycosyltransferase family 2 protein [Pontiellaceae bacterium]MBN2784538.1 glycosyltransferase family 2 protein [Pontiellaceae bacterium]
MLTIITISYNSSQILSHCLGPLIDSKAYPFIIIDNASTDGSATTLLNRFPQATIISLPKNIGYGRAANVGLNQVKTEYGLLLNPDLTATPESIERLLNHARSDTANAIAWGPASQEQDVVQSPPESAEWISGCAMLFNMKKLREIGLFDENIFLFFEETDLCSRIRDAGGEIRFCPDVLFQHMLGQASTPSSAIEWMKNWHYGWSRCYYFDKRGLGEGKRSPKRQYRLYRWKSIISTDSRKRIKYKAQAQGARAFIAGEKAFLPDGSPQERPGHKTSYTADTA